MKRRCCRTRSADRRTASRQPRVLVLRPRFSTVSIMPVIEARAPERTDTRSGCCGRRILAGDARCARGRLRPGRADPRIGVAVGVIVLQTAVVMVEPGGTAARGSPSRPASDLAASSSRMPLPRLAPPMRSPLPLEAGFAAALPRLGRFWPAGLFGTWLSRTSGPDGVPSQSHCHNKALLTLSRRLLIGIYAFRVLTTSCRVVPAPPYILPASTAGLRF